MSGQLYRLRARLLHLPVVGRHTWREAYPSDGVTVDHVRTCTWCGEFERLAVVGRLVEGGPVSSPAPSPGRTGHRRRA